MSHAQIIFIKCLNSNFLLIVSEYKQKAMALFIHFLYKPHAVLNSYTKYFIHQHATVFSKVFEVLPFARDFASFTKFCQFRRFRQFRQVSPVSPGSFVFRLSPGLGFVFCHLSKMVSPNNTRRI